jgi:drug/metabolite transporter (DMT)-like permease
LIRTEASLPPLHLHIGSGHGDATEEGDEHAGDDDEELNPGDAHDSAGGGDNDGGHPGRTPLLYWVVLGAALVAISCAGTLLRQLAPTPPLLKSFWRLFFVAWFLGVGFVWQWRGTATAEQKERFRDVQTMALLFLTGAITAAHFGCWIWSLQHTSLSHSLFFVCMHPLLIVAVMRSQGVRLTWFEAAGVALGLAGSVLMLVDDVAGSGAAADASAGGNDATGAIAVTWQGDLMAFLGAVAMVGYLYSGKHCRAYLPLFFYAFPVTLLASLWLLACSLAFEEGITWAGLGPNSVFGFLSPSHGALGWMILIALGPGLTGHLGIQFVLARVPPLAVSLVITVEPILGALVGMAAGVEDPPHLFTLLGGPLTLAGCLLAVYGSWKREQDLDEEHRRDRDILRALQAVEGAAGIPTMQQQQRRGESARSGGGHNTAEFMVGDLELTALEWEDEENNLGLGLSDHGDDDDLALFEADMLRHHSYGLQQQQQQQQLQQQQRQNAAETAAAAAKLDAKSMRAMPVSNGPAPSSSPGASSASVGSSSAVSSSGASARHTGSKRPKNAHYSTLANIGPADDEDDEEDAAAEL